MSKSTPRACLQCNQMMNVRAKLDVCVTCRSSRQCPQCEGPIAIHTRGICQACRFANAKPRPGYEQCKVCSAYRLSEEFSWVIDRSGRRGDTPYRRTQCDRCVRRLADNSENVFRYRLKTKAKSYGLDPDEVWAYYLAHDGKCEICSCSVEDSDVGHRGAKRLAIDHCHETGEFRGLLCHACNKALGLFRDNPEFLAKAIDYLRR